MESVAAQLFSGLSRDARSGSSRAVAGTLKDIENCPEATPALSWLGCALRFIVLLEGEPSPQFEDLCSLLR